MIAWRRGHRKSAAALAAGLVLRVLLLVHHPRFGGDAVVYSDIAHNVLAHHVYGLSGDGIQSTLIRLPGYPLFLAACFVLFGVHDYFAVLAVQVMASLVACWMVGDLARRLFGMRAGLATLWLACVCPFTAVFDAVVLTEALSLVCVAAAFWALERWVEGLRRGVAGWRWVVGIGCVLSYAVLLRPEQGLLGVAVVAAMLRAGWRYARVREAGVRWVTPALVAVLIVALPLGAWAWRNWRAFHVWQPLAPRYANDPGEMVPFGFQRWYRSWNVEYASSVRVYWHYNERDIALSDLPARAFDSVAQRMETARVLAEYNKVDSETPEIDADFGRLAVARVRRHWVRYYFVLPVAREIDMWFRPRTEFTHRLPLDWWRVGEHPWGSGAEVVYAVVDWAYVALAVVGLARWRGWWSDDVALAMVGFVVLRCALLLAIVNAETRYTIECFPVIFVLAGLALGGKVTRGMRFAKRTPAAKAARMNEWLRHG